MEYHIISGTVVETRRSFLPVRSLPKKRRGTRLAGKSSERKISHNERSEVMRLARLLNANFFQGGYLLSMKYSPERLPLDYAAARLDGEKTMRKLRNECKKQGVELKRVLITSNWDPEKNKPARFHHHVVINEIPLDILRKVWPEGELIVRSLRKGDFSKMAWYLYHNVKEEEGQSIKHWSSSQNLAKPIYTEPVPVSDVENIEPIAGASEIVQEPTFDEDGRQVGSYMRCTLPAVPIVKGSTVKLQKIKRGGRKRE